MLNFDTYYNTCKALVTWKDFDFQWPEGVIRVDFGFGDPIVELGTEDG